MIRAVYIIFFMLCGMVTSVYAQAPINSNVALQPPKGGVIVRQQLRYLRGDLLAGGDELDIEMLVSTTALVYGLSDRFTLILESPTVLSRTIRSPTTQAESSDSGFGDLRLMSKLRLYRDDFGIASTARFDLIGGVELPTGTDGFSSDSVDPIIGGVYSLISGRHGVNADAIWKFNTGSESTSPDVLKYDLAYSYRLSPEVYASEKPAALFGGLELNGFARTDGDRELLLSPGIQYVTQRWIIEATIQIPIWQEIRSGVEQEYLVGISFRFQF